MTERAASDRDQTAFLAEQLGREKTEAEETGHRQVTQFKQIEHLVGKLAERGLPIAAVVFDDPVTQAAWLAHTKTAHPSDIPMMNTEDELAILRGVV